MFPAGFGGFFVSGNDSKYATTDGPGAGRSGFAYVIFFNKGPEN
jgi:hypothetical protein